MTKRAIQWATQIIHTKPDIINNNTSNNYNTVLVLSFPFWILYVAKFALLSFTRGFT